jgi:hypothetical protein
LRQNNAALTNPSKHRSVHDLGRGDPLFEGLAGLELHTVVKRLGKCGPYIA